VRKQRILIIWMTCLLLGAVSGCNNEPKIPQGRHHNPIGGGIDADGNAFSGSPKSVSVVIDEGGNLTIALPTGSGKKTEFDIESKLNGKAAPICAGQLKNPFTTTLDFSCTVVNQDGDYLITVTAQAPPNGTKHTSAPIPSFTAYVRSCKGC
jgi:hypothetical protein